MVKQALVVINVSPVAIVEVFIERVVFSVEVCSHSFGTCIEDRLMLLDLFWHRLVRVHLAKGNAARSIVDF